MKIKRIEIKGFKSFPDKTVLEFKSGITAIVGPNGCGKSNVLEAMRWAMGEQKVRSLRGKKMEDVIFNGSESRKPVGMAEVRLVLSNSKGIGPPAMADYDEIMIGRRLFRDGESQYEINNIPCRLSDITDFFLDTGVGKNSYAIIEQGRVDMVVASKPEDRRVLIEEAAGISRYKVRREAAIRKLEKTKQNLLRISDVINEVKRQSNALKRQASRAERYGKLTARLKELDLAFHALRCADLQENLSRLRKELESKRAAYEETESTFSALEARLEERRLEALRLEKDLTESLETRHALDVELTGLRVAAERDAGRLSELERIKTRSDDEIASVREKIDVGRQGSAELEKDKAALKVDLDAARLAVQELLDGTRESRELLAEKERLLNRLKEDLFNKLQETAQERNRKESLTKRGKEIQSRMTGAREESVALNSSLEKDFQDTERHWEEIRNTAQHKSEAVTRKERLVSARQESLNQIEILRDQLAVAEKELAALTARHESLTEMESGYVSYGEGVRFLMQDGGLLENGALRGPLASIMDVPEEFQRALAGALGERLGHLVVASTRTGAEAANRLEAAGVGRSTFIPISPRSGDDRLEDSPDGLTSLMEVVRFRQGYEGLGEFLLGRFFVVDDMRQAMEIWEKNGLNVDLVTRSGDVLNRHGEITGGSRENGRGDIFGRRREIEALQAKMSAVQESIGGLQDAFNDRDIEQEDLSREIDRTERTINDLNMQEVRQRKDLESLEERIAASERRKEVQVLEYQALVRESDEASQEISGAEERIVLLEKRQSELEKEREDTNRKVDELTAILDEKSRQSGEFQVEKAKLEERVRSLDKEIHTACETLIRLEEQLASILQEKDNHLKEERVLVEQVEARRKGERDLMEKHESLARHGERLKRDSEELTASIKTLEEESGRSGRAAKELRDIVHGLEMEAVRLEQALEGLVEKILERYGTDPRTVEAPDAPPDEQEIARLKSKVESMGEVNLAAISESQHAEERLAFLVEQEEDLNEAVASLFATISRINKTTRERFKQAFANINEKFQEIFPFLFRGGEARLELTDEDDLLETGVDIMARPPGKRIQNMQLLSGGEKALTAVALIFSIFLTRPSPFCLLDEVDAPLDDSNLARFNEMLRRLSDLTQFLTITHNKASMEAADTLYGVTMEEPGTSAVVAVEFMDRPDEREQGTSISLS
jgi:chromosome segregation protein